MFKMGYSNDSMKKNAMSGTLLTIAVVCWFILEENGCRIRSVRFFPKFLNLSSFVCMCWFLFIGWLKSILKNLFWYTSIICRSTHFHVINAPYNNYVINADYNNYVIDAFYNNYVVKVTYNTIIILLCYH